MSMRIVFVKDGKEIGTLDATAKEFSTGSVGYFAHGKIHMGDAKLQVSSNIVLVGSKELTEEAKLEVLEAL